jgi:HNH endonuclease
VLPLRAHVPTTSTPRGLSLSGRRRRTREHGGPLLRMPHWLSHPTSRRLRRSASDLHPGIPPGYLCLSRWETGSRWSRSVDDQPSLAQLTAEQRLLLKILSSVEITDKGCWEWQKSKSGGYGQIGGDVLGIRRPLRVHRVMWFLTHGAWPNVVHHTCVNRACCNPQHLIEMGTRSAHTQLHYGDCCPRGHRDEFRTQPDGARRCRRCDRERKREERRLSSDL